MSRFAVPAVLLALLVGVVRADVKAPDPIPQRMLRASVLVFVGKVASIEEKAITLESTPAGRSKLNYKVAVVSVTEGLLGTAKSYRVAFIDLGRRRGFDYLNFKAGDEGLFFLTKVHGQATYRVWSYEDMVPKNDKNKQYFEEQLAAAKRCAKLLADPDKGLASKDKEDRFLTAAMLVLRYRTPPIADPKTRVQTAVPAARSKAILQTLAEGDWTAGRDRFGQLTPQSLFGRLGVTEKDGWKPPQDFTKYAASAKQWLTDNAEKYRIQSWGVMAPKDNPEPNP